MLHDDDALYLASRSAISMRGEAGRLLQIAERVQGMNDELVSLQSKLGAYRVLAADMLSWHDVMAFRDFEEHEAQWKTYLKRAEELLK